MRPGDHVRVSAPYADFDARLIEFRRAAILVRDVEIEEGVTIPVKFLAVEDDEHRWWDMAGRNLIIKAANATAERSDHNAAMPVLRLPCDRSV
jgi:hypothetical protein